MAWTYKVHEAAARQLKALGPAARQEIVAWLEKRTQGAADPTRFGKPLKGSKHGLWRYRIRDYRLICKLEHNVLVVVVVAVGHRSTIYDD